MHSNSNKIERILDRRTRYRHGRGDVQYRVVYVDDSDKESGVWQYAKDLKKGNKANKDIIEVYEGQRSGQAKAINTPADQPFTQEPFSYHPFTQGGASETQHEDLGAFLAHAGSRLRGQPNQVPSVGYVQSNSLPAVDKGPDGNREPNDTSSEPAQAVQQASCEVVPDSEDCNTGLPAVVNESEIDPLQLTSAQLEDLDSLFPPLAPRPGFRFGPAACRMQPTPLLDNPRATTPHSLAPDSAMGGSGRRTDQSNGSPQLAAQGMSSPPNRTQQSAEMINADPFSRPQDIGQLMPQGMQKQAPASGRETVAGTGLSRDVPDLAGCSQPAKQQGAMQTPCPQMTPPSLNPLLQASVTSNDAGEAAGPVSVSTKTPLAAGPEEPLPAPMRSPLGSPAISAKRRCQSLIAKHAQPSSPPKGLGPSPVGLARPPPSTAPKTVSAPARSASQDGSGTESETSSREGEAEQGLDVSDGDRPRTRSQSNALHVRRTAIAKLASKPNKTSIASRKGERGHQPVIVQTTSRKRRRLSVTGDQVERNAEDLTGQTEDAQGGQSTTLPSKAAEGGKQDGRTATESRASETVRGLPELSPRRNARHRARPQSFEKTYLWSPNGQGRQSGAPILPSRQGGFQQVTLAGGNGSSSTSNAQPSLPQGLQVLLNALDLEESGLPTDPASSRQEIRQGNSERQNGPTGRAQPSTANPFVKANINGAQPPRPGRIIPLVVTTAGKPSAAAKSLSHASTPREPSAAAAQNPNPAQPAAQSTAATGQSPQAEEDVIALTSSGSSEQSGSLYSGAAEGEESRDPAWDAFESILSRKITAAKETADLTTRRLHRPERSAQQRIDPAALFSMLKQNTVHNRSALASLVGSSRQQQNQAGNPGAPRVAQAIPASSNRADNTEANRMAKDIASNWVAACEPTRRAHANDSKSPEPSVQARLPEQAELARQESTPVVSRTPSIEPGDTQDLSDGKGRKDCEEGAVSSLESGLQHRLTAEAWCHAEVSGAKQQNGVLQIRVEWADGFATSLPSETLKRYPHCLLKLVEFYESRVKPTARK